MREEIFVHPGEEYSIELQALGCVDGHQRDPVNLPLVFIRFRIKRNFFQERFQGRILGSFLVPGHGGAQFVDVLQALQALSACLLQLRNVPAVLCEFHHHISQRNMPQAPGALSNHPNKGCQLLGPAIELIIAVGVSHYLKKSGVCAVPVTLKER